MKTLLPSSYSAFPRLANYPKQVFGSQFSPAQEPMLPLVLVLPRKLSFDPCFGSFCEFLSRELVEATQAHDRLPQGVWALEGTCTHTHTHAGTHARGAHASHDTQPRGKAVLAMNLPSSNSEVHYEHLGRPRLTLNFFFF